MNYQEMSDFEINKAVAIAIGGFSFNDDGFPCVLTPNSWPAYSGIDFDEVEFDPCNQWADAGPIIEKYRIELIPDSPDSSCHSDHKWWDAAFYSGGMKVCGVKNVIRPLRAAMIVFLMMKGGE